MTRQEYEENVKKAIDLNTKSKSLCNEVLSQSLGQINKAYNEGFNDAQETMKKLFLANVGTLFEKFGVSTRRDIFEKFSLQEIKMKLEEAEDEKNRKDFQVGDVVYTTHPSVRKAVIVSSDGDISLRFGDGEILKYSTDFIQKTGENVDIRYYDYE